MAVRIDAQRGRRPVRNISTGPRAFADYSNIGRGIEAVGRQVEQRQAEREREREIEQRRADAVYVSKASSQARVEFAGLYDEMAAEYDGAEPGFVETVETRLSEEINTRLENLSGERRDRLAMQLDGVRASLLLAAHDTERGRREAHALNGISETVDLERNAVLSDSGQVWAALDNVDQLVEAAPERVRGELAEEIRGELAAAYVDARLGEDPRALQAELDGGDLDALLAPEIKARALSSAEAAIARLDREAERARDQERLYSLIAMQPAAEDHLASLAATGAPAEGFDEDAYTALLTPQAAASYTRRAAAARSAYEAVGDFSSLTPQAMAERVERLRPEPGAAGFARRAEEHQLAVQVMERELAAREDPADHVRGAVPVTRARERVSQALAGGDLAEITAAQTDLATALLAEQERIGVPEGQRRVLSDAAAEGIVADVEEADDPGAAMRDLLGVLDTWGDHRGRVLSELIGAGLDPAAATVAEFGDQPAMAARLARAVTGRREARDIVSEDARDIDDTVRSALAPFLETFSAAPNAPAASAGVVAAAEALAYDYAARGMPPREAAERAAGAFLERYAFVDTYRIPRAVADAPRQVSVPAPSNPGPGERLGARDQSMTGERLVAQGADHAFTALIADGGARVAPMIGLDLPVREAAGLTADALAASGQWVTLPDETGLGLVVDLDGLASPVRDARGAPVTFSWAELERLGRARLERRSAALAFDDLMDAREGATGPRARPQ